MTSSIIISIIIPVYNVENYLIRCLETIYSQIDEQCEVILVNDGSKDGSCEICESFESKYPSITQFFHRDNNQGAGFVRNFGLDRAKGDYIWFVDSDDKIGNDALRNIKNVILHNSSIDIVTTGFKRFSDKSEGKLENVFEQQIVSGEKYLTTGNFNPYLWCNIYRTSFLRENNIRFRDDLVSQEDWLFNAYAYVAAKKIFLADFQTYYYYQGNPNSTLSRRDEKHLLRGVDNTIKAECEMTHFLEGLKGTSVYKPLRRRLNLTSAGFLYSLYRFYLPINIVKDSIKVLRQNKLYPIGWSNNRKANVFSTFANCKWLFIAICRLRNMIRFITQSN